MHVAMKQQRALPYPTKKTKQQSNGQSHNRVEMLSPLPGAEEAELSHKWQKEKFTSKRTGLLPRFATV